MTPPDTTPPEERETLRCSSPGAPLCLHLFCTPELAVAGSDPPRCPRHLRDTRPTVKMNPAVLEVLCEATR